MQINIISKTLNLIEKLNEYCLFNIKKEDNFYNLVITSLKDNLLNIDVEDELIREIKEYIRDLEIEKLNIKIKKVLYENKLILSNINELKEWYKEIKITKNYSEGISNLSDISLEDMEAIPTLLFLQKVLSMVNYIMKDNYVLLKYGRNINDFGHNKLTKVSRGVVVNHINKEVVSYPFNKFFNLNEDNETNFDKVYDLEKRANVKTALVKEDGSTICVTKVNDNNLLITTNGCFDNEQIDMAKIILNKKYKFFIDNMDCNKSYIFEIIYPDNRIVLDYKDKEELILLAIRDLNNHKLLKYCEVTEEANKFKLNIVKEYPFKDIKELVNKAKSLKNANMEGWVIRLISEDEDLMLKVKLEEYFALHFTRYSKITPYKVFKMKKNEVLDDILANSMDEMIIKINKAVDSLEIIKLELSEEIEIISREIFLKYGVNGEVFSEYKNGVREKDNNFIEVIKHINSLKEKIHPIIASAVSNKIFRNTNDIDEYFYNISNEKMQKYLAYKGFLDNEDISG